VTKLPKHHYVPVFYLREWAGNDGRLAEFSRPTGNDVKSRPAGPKGTGYVRGLYRFEGATEDAAEAFERLFFGHVDSLAKQALDIHLGRSKAKWNGDSRSAWSRFIIGMLYRNPERIATLRKYIEDIALDNYEVGREEYEAQTSEGDPPFLDYLVRKIAYDALDWTTTIMNNEKIGLHLNHMRWVVRDVSDSGLKLFTSDRPVLMTNGLTGEKAHLVMPISPTRAFIASNNETMERELLGHTSTEFAKGCNRNILRFAQKYAWNTDDQFINRANEHLSVDAAAGEEFFLAEPRRALEEVRKARPQSP
jgi:Protein of unknown function (DUF4238)